MSSAKAFFKIFQLLHLNYRSYTKIKQEPADFDSLIWQLRLALLSHFTCPDNERRNLRSRRLLVVFHAKANSLALAIFKQRIPISQGGSIFQRLPPFSLIRDFGKQNTCGKVSKISVSLACYRQIEIHQSQPTSMT